MTCCLLDGTGLMFQAFHGMPSMEYKGRHTGAAFGFLRWVLQIVLQYRTPHVVVFFDSRNNIRKDLDPEYKANRPPTPYDITYQFEIAREACSAFGIKSFVSDGYEADDCIASWVNNRPGPFAVVSADKDLMQLLRSDLHIWHPMRRKVVREAELMEKWGIRPHQVIDFQALVGDSVDNVPGVPGIGLKRAAALLNEYHTIEGIYEHMDILPQKIAKSLDESRDLLAKSHALVTLRLDVDLGDAVSNIDCCYDRAHAFLVKNNFLSLRGILSDVVEFLRINSSCNDDAVATQ